VLFDLFLFSLIRTGATCDENKLRIGFFLSTNSDT